MDDNLAIYLRKLTILYNRMDKNKIYPTVDPALPDTVTGYSTDDVLWWCDNLELVNWAEVMRVCNQIWKQVYIRHI